MAQPLWSPGPRVPAHVGQTCHPGDKANAVNLKFPLFVLFLSHSHILQGFLRTVSTCVPKTGLYLFQLLSLLKKDLTQGLRTTVLFFFLILWAGGQGRPPGCSCHMGA